MTLTAHAELAHVAIRIHEQLEQRRRCAPPELPTAAWERCERLMQLLELSAARGWHAAVTTCRYQLRWAVQDVRRQLDAFTSELDRQPALSVSSPREILDDLIALEAEFGEVRIDAREQTLAVSTDAIVLDGIDLGRFEILLRWQGMGNARCPYSVVALEPRPAAASSETTHPHVQGEQLCEGEGSGAVRAALTAGRILDFFVIVSQILGSYNADSAYVALEDWDGTSCSDCGDAVGGDDRTVCEGCHCDVCDSCTGSCTACDRYFCGACIRSCAGCLECNCENCLAACPCCGRNFCGGCLVDEACQQCQAAMDELDDLGDSPVVPVASGPADALCLG